MVVRMGLARPCATGHRTPMLQCSDYNNYAQEDGEKDIIHATFSRD